MSSERKPRRDRTSLVISAVLHALVIAGGGIPPAAALAAGKQNGNLLIGVVGTPNGRYQWQAVERLGQTWLPVGEPLALDAQGRGQFVIPMEGTGRFFRLQSLNP